jgi:asparagine synthase (glutamine-hydrolysing)
MSPSIAGLEPRTPFLDKQFVAAYLSIATALRRPRRLDDGCSPPATAARVEKQLLREAFDDACDPLLPPDVLWRRKEAFSDGVSAPTRSWYEIVQEKMEALIPGEEGWTAECARYGAGPTAPFTKESLYYRRLFEAAYGAEAAGAIPYFWLPKWSGGARDPSARTLKVYAAAGQLQQDAMQVQTTAVGPAAEEGAPAAVASQ